MPRDGSGIYSKAAGTTAVSGQTIESAKYNSQVDDMVADLNAARPITAGGTGATTAAGAQTNLGLLPGTFGFLYGLTLSNNGSDATNDIDIAAGTAASDAASPTLITLASAITKRLDAAWAVGTNQGGLDTGSIANTSYHVWLIQRSDTLVVDVLLSASATAPTMPANYDRKRRIGSIIRESAAIVTFRQVGDLFKRTALTITSATTTFASTLFGTGAPSGIVTQPILKITSSAAVSTNTSTSFGDGAVGSADTQVQSNFAGTGGSSLQVSVIPPVFNTTTGGQIYISNTVTGTINSFSIVGLGWVDTRGRI